VDLCELGLGALRDFEHQPFYSVTILTYLYSTGVAKQGIYTTTH
jgi:hypothetical protein